MRLSDFDYVLPEGAIATVPAEPRDSSRLLAVDRAGGEMRDHVFRDLPDLLRAGDVLVVNDTRVIPARFFGEGTGGGKLEFLLLRRLGENDWECLVKPGKRVRSGIRVKLPGNRSAEVGPLGEGRFRITFEGDILPWLDQYGAMPLPPYFKRPADESDRRRYQTVFASDPASIAAPTAGLHFTPELLSRIEGKGVEIRKVTLDIGYGTFSPIRVENLDEHVMHEETYGIPDETFAALKRAKGEGRRVLAVGTTSLRALESIPTRGLRGSTDLFIRPGFQFQWVDGLITNFHLPQSSLLVLVSAFLGRERTLAAYGTALERGYRFFSYGDAMWIA